MKTSRFVLLIGGAAMLAFLAGRSGDVGTAEADYVCSKYGSCSGASASSDWFEAVMEAEIATLDQCNGFSGVEMGCCSGPTCDVHDYDGWVTAYCSGTPYIEAIDAWEATGGGRGINTSGGAGHGRGSDGTFYNES
jgi:hypothetical protein